MKKKMLCIVVVLLMAFSLAGCGSSAYDDGYKYGYSDGEHDGYQEGFEDGQEAGYEQYVERAEESFDPDEIIDWVLYHYSIEDLMEWKYGSVGDYYFEVGAPNIGLFIDECIDQGHTEYVRYMLNFCETLGYYPSLLLGDYCADGNRCIHWVGGPCFENIAINDLIVLPPYGSFKRLVAQYEDAGYTVCEKCCDENGHIIEPSPDSPDIPRRSDNS